MKYTNYSVGGGNLLSSLLIFFEQCLPQNPEFLVHPLKPPSYKISYKLPALFESNIFALFLTFFLALNSFIILTGFFPIRGFLDPLSFLIAGSGSFNY